jgi:hypothetical protein
MMLIRIRIRIPKFYACWDTSIHIIVSKKHCCGSGMFIPGPDLNRYRNRQVTKKFSKFWVLGIGIREKPIPDPGVKNHRIPDPEHR